jgi:hypothetical protein
VVSNLFVVAPFSGTITGWQLSANTNSTVTVDVLLNGESITASAPPTMVSDNYAETNTLTGWTTTFAKGDVFTLDVVGNSAANTIILYLTAEQV